MVSINLRRVLILADESASWIVAGLAQLDRLALAIDAFAQANQGSAPILITILWRPGIDQSDCWVPTPPQLTRVAFTRELESEGYDLILSTHFFLYRGAIARWIAEQPREGLGRLSWDEYFSFTRTLTPARDGAWERIDEASGIAAVETRFLRGSGKSQDGFVSRHLNRPISRAMTRFLLRHPVTPNAWTWLIAPLPLLAALIMSRGFYSSFVWGLVLFQVFSVLDGCDGEIARAKYLQSERGRQLDDFFDVLSNILLVLGLGVGLSRHALRGIEWLYLAEGVVAGILIALNEWTLALRKPGAPMELKAGSLGETLYPRHRELVQRSGLLRFGEKFASLLIQLTKRDVAVLFFVFLALIGWPSLILHLLLLVTAITLALALKK